MRPRFQVLAGRRLERGRTKSWTNRPWNGEEFFAGGPPSAARGAGGPSRGGEELAHVHGDFSTQMSLVRLTEEVSQKNVPASTLLVLANLMFPAVAPLAKLVLKAKGIIEEGEGRGGEVESGAGASSAPKTTLVPRVVKVLQDRPGLSVLSRFIMKTLPNCAEEYTWLFNGLRKKTHVMVRTVIDLFSEGEAEGP